MNLSHPEPAPRNDNRPLAVVTGASGFIGRHLVSTLAEAGWRLRLLMRQPPIDPEWRGIRPQVVAGAVSDNAALARLVEGADAVIHLAGLIKAARRDHFFDVNRDGAAALARAVQRGAPGAHFVLVSSQAAREPSLSDYAASKRAGEAAVLQILGPRASVLRPPAVYGPGDRETLLFFQLARRRWVPLLGARDAHVAMIHARDLAHLIVALLAVEPCGQVITAADGRPQGYRWDELMAAAVGAVGNRSARFVRAPQVLLGGAAWLGDLAHASGRASMFNSQKLRELRHADWSVAPAELALPMGWAPQFDLDRGFADAVAWYRAAQWLEP